jgi:ribosome biogenesis GTPase A
MAQKTEMQQRQIEGFTAYLNKLSEAMSKYPNQPAARRIEEYRRQFKRKVNDFFRENRKLQFAVIGQVKAGKSSFINTLLFGGKPVLPSACTPKTSV